MFVDLADVTPHDVPDGHHDNAELDREGIKPVRDAVKDSSVPEFSFVLYLT